MTHPTFQIIQQPNHTFNVSLTTAAGRLKTVVGFSSEHEAAAWVVQTERALHDADPLFRTVSREKSQS